MSSKKMIWIGGLIGSFVGSYIPKLWGEGVFSVSSIFLSGVGAVAGMYIMFKINE